MLAALSKHTFLEVLFISMQRMETESDGQEQEKTLVRKPYVLSGQCCAVLPAASCCAAVSALGSRRCSVFACSCEGLRQGKLLVLVQTLMQLF